MPQGKATVNTPAQVLVRDQSQDRLVRNTFVLLSMVLAVAAGGGFLGLASGIQWSMGMWVLLMVAFIGGPFLIGRIQGQAAIGVTFVWAGLIGFLLSPMVGAYLAMPGGTSIVVNALVATAVIFVGLAGYAVVSKRDFSFMGSFLVAGMLVVLLAIIANIFLQLPMLSLVISSVAVLLMSGMILYDVSRLLREGPSSALEVVVALFADIVVLFSHLLNLSSFLSGDD